MTNLYPAPMILSIFILGTLSGLFQQGTSLILPNSIIPSNLRTDNKSIQLASKDFGNIVYENPAAVLDPTSIYEIANLIKFVYRTDTRINVAARGQGHSVRGQAFAENGIVINMTSLSNYRDGRGIVVSPDGSFVDVGGERLWVDVLNETLKSGRTPISWTNYLYLSIGGTLSNAGIGGQTFRYGPQISNVMEMDVITGKGELTTCSPAKNSELFFGALGGLGQFGIITRARIVLDRAPTKVKWVRALYTNFSAFTSDQEHLILTNANKRNNALDYVEGLLLLSIVTQDNTSFFPVADQPRIASLIKQHGIIYCLEVVKYHYDNSPKSNANKRYVSRLESQLNFESGFIFERDLTYLDFTNRFHANAQRLEKLGQWDQVPHPWLNLFVPKSRMADFNVGVYRDILLKNNITNGTFLIYPVLRNKWDDRTSAVLPDEDISYAVGFELISGFGDWQLYDNHLKDVLEFCSTAGIQAKQYLAHYETQKEWSKHFGSKWETFYQRKYRFDPKKLLSPGQKIFN